MEGEHSDAWSWPRGLAWLCFPDETRTIVPQMTTEAVKMDS